MRKKRKQVELTPQDIKRAIGSDGIDALNAYNKTGDVTSVIKDIEVVSPILRECCIITRKSIINVRKEFTDTIMVKIYDMIAMLNKENLVCHTNGQPCTYESFAKYIGFEGVTDRYARFMKSLNSKGVIAYKKRIRLDKTQRLIVFNPYICTRSYEVDKKALELFEDYKYE